MPRHEHGYDSHIQLELDKHAIGMDPEAFDELIHSNGIQMVHYAAMRCPVGLTDPDDLRRACDHHIDCSNGFLYQRMGELTVGFIGNGGDTRFSDAGRLDSSTVTVVLPRFYDDGDQEQVEVSVFDRMFLKENPILVSTWQTFAVHVSGHDRLMFPVEKVRSLVDSRGKSYKQGVDFTVSGGQLHWLENRSPGIDAKSGRGVVCSIRYQYHPFWYVSRLNHEVRVAQVEDPDTGDRVIKRFPQEAVLQRENHFQKEQVDPQANSPEQRQKPGPRKGEFGSR